MKNFTVVKKTFCSCGYLQTLYKFLLFLGAVLALAVTPCQAAETDDIVKIRENAVLKVAIKGDLPRISFKDPVSREFKGFEVALAYRIAKEIDPDLEVEFTEITTANREAILDNGYVDCIIASFSITDERLKSHDFSEPYFHDHTGLLVRKDSNIRELKDLNNKVIGCIYNSNSPYELVKSLKEHKLIDESDVDLKYFDFNTFNKRISFKPYESYEAIIEALENKEIDGFVNDKTVLASFLKDDYLLLQEEFGIQHFAVVTRKGSSLSALINSFIKKWNADGTMEKIIKENFD